MKSKFIFSCCLLLAIFITGVVYGQGGKETATSVVDLQNTYSKVDKLKTEKKYEEAIELLVTALKSNPKDVRLLRTLGQLYVENGKPELSESILKQSIDFAVKDLDKAWAHYWLSRAYSGLNNIAASKSEIQNALQYYPEEKIFKQQAALVQGIEK